MIRVSFQVMSGLDSHCYFKHYQYQLQRKPQLPAEFILKQQKLCWPRCRHLTHESGCISKPSGKGKSLCRWVRALLALIACVHSYMCVYFGCDWLVTAALFTWQLHNKQLYLAQDFRREEGREGERWTRQEGEEGKGVPGLSPDRERCEVTLNPCGFKGN